MPKVSICIPTYEKHVSLKRLLDSIAKQKYCDIEVIITDNSKLPLKSTFFPELLNDKVKYFHNYPSLEPARNWNKCLSLATGEYIKIMFDDDWFADENSLGNFVNLLEFNSDCGFAFCGSWQVSSTSKFSRAITDKQAKRIQNNYKNLMNGNFIGAPSAVFYRKNAFLFDDKLKWLVDVDFYMSIFCSGIRFCYTKEPLVCIGLSDEQLTNSCITDKKLVSFERSYIMKKYNISYKFLMPELCREFKYALCSRIKTFIKR